MVKGSNTYSTTCVKVLFNYLLQWTKYLGFDSCSDSIQAPQVKAGFPTDLFVQLIQMEKRQFMQAEILQKMKNEISSFKCNCYYDSADLTNRLYVAFRQQLREDRMALLTYKCKVRKDGGSNDFSIEHRALTPENNKSLGLHILLNSGHNEKLDYERAFVATMKTCS